MEPNCSHLPLFISLPENSETNLEEREPTNFSKTVVTYIKSNVFFFKSLIWLAFGALDHSLGNIEERERGCSLIFLYSDSVL